MTRRNVKDKEIADILQDVITSDSDDDDGDFSRDDSEIDINWLPNDDSSSDTDSEDAEFNVFDDEHEENHDYDDEDEQQTDAGDDNNTMVPNSKDIQINWAGFSSRQKTFPFTGKSGLLIDVAPNISCLDAFKLFVDDEIIDHIVCETNNYAQQQLETKTLARSSRKLMWSPTTNREIKKFFGLILWMGLVKVGSLETYWSKEFMFNFGVPAKTMSRNRFQLLLNFIHFANNRDILPGDKLGRISPISDMLQANFQKVYMPGENIVIDESIIPWRGRLSFRQYLPNKTHPYGVKLFKLCTQEGFTWSVKVYSGKSATGVRETSLAKKVCEELSCLLKGEGRTLFVDNYYTSYELACSMLHQKTHLVGTLRANKNNCPAEVMKANLKRGEMVAREEENGVVVLKWKDTRDVRILSTKHPPVMVATSSHRNVDSNEPSTSTNNPPSTRKRRQRAFEKPLAVIDYHKAKLGVDVSDQMTSYATTLRRGVKWYRKVAFELLLGMSVVNAFIIYKKATNKQISITKFRQETSNALLDFMSPEPITKGKHFIEKRKDDNGKTIRRACVLCYAMSRKSADRVTARKSLKRTTTYCPICPNKPQLCVECFPKYSHQKN